MHQYWTFLIFCMRTSGKPLKFGPCVFILWRQIKEEFPWLLVTTVSFKFCFCYTAQLLCEPHKLCVYIYIYKNPKNNKPPHFYCLSLPKGSTLNKHNSNSVAGCCITPVRREMGGWQDAFVCLFFFFLVFWVYVGGVKPQLKGQVSPASSKRKTSSITI